MTPGGGRGGAAQIAVACALLLAIGVFVGAVTTFTHRQEPPVGVLAGLAIVACLLTGARLVFGSRVVAGAAAIGVLGAAALLSLPGAGGSVLVADGPLGWTWALGAPLIAAVVLAWPTFQRRAARAAAVSDAQAPRD